MSTTIVLGRKNIIDNPGAKQHIVTEEEMISSGMVGFERYVNDDNSYIDDSGKVVFDKSKLPSIEILRRDKKLIINDATVKVLNAGFNYDVDGVTYHFNYDGFDQPNFSDSAIAAIISTIQSNGDVSAIPETISWNAYKNWNGTSGEYTVLSFTAQTFVPLYAAALKHKSDCWAENATRNSLLMMADTPDEVMNI